MHITFMAWELGKQSILKTTFFLKRHVNIIKVIMTHYTNTNWGVSLITTIPVFKKTIHIHYKPLYA